MTATPSTGSGQSDGLRPVKFSRLSKRVLLVGLSAPQLAAIAAGILPALAGLYLGTFVYALPFTIAGFALATVPVGGQVLVDWLPVAAAWVWRTLAGQLRFTARPGRPRPAGTLALPGRAAALRHHVDAVTGAGLVHDPHAGTLCVTVPVTSPAFGLLDPADQARRVAGWGRVLAGVCRSGRIAALQVTERTWPGSGTALTDWWTSHRASGDDSFAARVYGELIERAGPVSERHQTLIRLVLDMRKAARAIRAAGGGLGGAAAVLRQETETLTAALRSADLTVGAPLGPSELALWLRTAYDPDSAARLEAHPGVGRDLEAAGPMAVAESWDALRSDGAWHAVLWISQWPQSLTYPGFLAPVLLASGISRTVAIRYQPVAADQAARDLRRRKTGHITEAAQRARIGQIEDVTQTSEYDDVLAQEAELAAGHGLLRTTALITVTAPDADQLEHDVAAVEQAAVQAGIETRRLYGQQTTAFATVLAP
ncbi:SCO6880 family protein [Myceligenerans pegani]|uniref:PrgI family protein n=1 Tax=Myceligenerans pegani TaxID=2776917 RepID=A0ABR9N5P3_9MICO|nr:SCO6880 family protein [Myceligenerans sp. TRM 65318]MBE1878974.1 PrgI family protein [Myceligenerans sp. TRM 65318]MBE3021245.1 PrgI family protein [Myceligenerans sp. TRM 65318]